MKFKNGNGHVNVNDDKSHSKPNSNSKTRTREIVTFELEVRRSKVIGLISRGLTQTEIGQKLGVNQSTISDDLRYIRQQANRNIVEVTDNLSFEYLRCLASSDEISKQLWEISDFHIDPNNIDTNYIMNVNISNKNKIAALGLLHEINKQRIEAITGGTRSTHDFP
jgi:DNA-binding transcriptional regulator LsrR (DeoR family)